MGGCCCFEEVFVGTVVWLLYIFYYSIYLSAWLVELVNSFEGQMKEFLIISNQLFVSFFFICSAFLLKRWSFTSFSFLSKYCMHSHCSAPSNHKLSCMVFFVGFNNNYLKSSFYHDFCWWCKKKSIGSSVEIKHFYYCQKLKIRELSLVWLLFWKVVFVF